MHLPIALAASQHLLRGFVAAFLTIAVLDVIVAWALFIVLKPVNPHLSLLAAWLRLVYSVLLAAALAPVLEVLQLVGSSEYLAALDTRETSARVMILLNAFRNGWDIGLALFGCHLAVVGYLVIKSRFFPRFLGVLVGIAGAGYLFDSVGKIVFPSASLSIVPVTFIGEVLLMIWLIHRAMKGFGSRP